MRKNENLKYMEGGDKLWKALKNLDTQKKMPESFFEEWK